MKFLLTSIRAVPRTIPNTPYYTFYKRPIVVVTQQHLKQNFYFICKTIRLTHTMNRKNIHDKFLYRNPRVVAQAHLCSLIPDADMKPLPSSSLRIAVGTRHCQVPHLNKW